MPSFARLTSHGVDASDLDTLAKVYGRLPAEVNNPIRVIYWLGGHLPWPETVPLVRLWLLRALEDGGIVGHPNAQAVLHAMKPDLDIAALAILDATVGGLVAHYCRELPRADDGSIQSSDAATPKQAAWLAAWYAVRAATLAALPHKAIVAVSIDDREERIASDLCRLLWWGMLAAPKYKHDDRLACALQETCTGLASWVRTWSSSRPALA